MKKTRTTSPSKESSKKTPKLSFAELQKEVVQQLGCVVFLKAPKIWLRTKQAIDGVLGSRFFGIPAGRMYEVAGKKHGGKTALVMWLGGKAQRLCNAFVIWIDAEGSLQNESSDPSRFKNSWAAKLGLDTAAENFYLVYPKILIRKKARRKGKKVTKAGETIVQSAESLFDEAEKVVHKIKKAYPDRPIFIALDSIANLIPEKQEDAGFADGNMNTNMARAAMLSQALPRWVTLIVNYNMWFFNINQVRTKPGVAFGDPTYTPGGNALEHNCHVQVRIARSNKHSIEEDGKLVSIGGKITNIKNKAGGRSLQGLKCGYKVHFRKPFKKMWRFAELEE